MTAPLGDLSKNVFDCRGELYSIPVWVVSDPDNLDTNAPTQDSEDGKITSNLSNESASDISEGEAEQRREEKGKGTEATRLRLIARLSESITGNTDVKVFIGQGDSARLCSRKILEVSGVSTCLLY